MSATSTPRGGLARIADPLSVAITAVVAVSFLAMTALLALGVMNLEVAAGLGVLCTSIVAGLGFRAARVASRRSKGVEERFWRLMSYGLLSWTLGCVPYFAFLVTGGEVQSPAAWSQIGFLLAYPFWYRALWMLRQPALEESRRGRLEALGIELSTFAMLAAVVVGRDMDLGRRVVRARSHASTAAVYVSQTTQEPFAIIQRVFAGDRDRQLFSMEPIDARHALRCTRRCFRRGHPPGAGVRR